MWQTILIAGVALYVIKIFPIFVTGFDRIRQYPRFNKFLDYTICLVMGEVIYNIAFKDVADFSIQLSYVVLTASTLTLTALLMWFTNKLSASLLSGTTFFIIGYFLLNIYR